MQIQSTDSSSCSELIANRDPIRPHVVLAAEELQELAVGEEGLRKLVDVVGLARVLHPGVEEHVEHPLQLRPVAVGALQPHQARLLAVPQVVPRIRLRIPILTSLHPRDGVHHSI
jgi:hypothetical protein